MSGNNDLNPNQRKAIPALLENPTLLKAAEACGLNERTLRRFLEDPVFRAELQKREGIILDEMTRRLLQMSGKAVDALADVLEWPAQPGAANMRLAAKTVIDSLLKIRELVTVEQRLSDLEGTVYGDNSK